MCDSPPSLLPSRCKSNSAISGLLQKQHCQLVQTCVPCEEARRSPTQHQGQEGLLVKASMQCRPPCNVDLLALCVFPRPLCSADFLPLCSNFLPSFLSATHTSTPTNLLESFLFPPSLSLLRSPFLLLSHHSPTHTHLSLPQSRAICVAAIPCDILNRGTSRSCY